MKKILRIFFIFFFFVGLMPGALAENLEIIGDSSVLDYKKNLLSVEGNVQIKYKDVTGTCHKILYHITDGIVELSGTIKIKKNGSTLTGEKAIYHVQEGRITLEGQVTFTLEPNEKGPIK